MNKYLTDEFLGKSIKCNCGRVHEIPRIAIRRGQGVLRELPEVIEGIGLSGKTLLLADSRTWKAAGEAVCEVLTGSGTEVDPLVLEGAEIHTDTEEIDRICDRARGCGFLTACGSGTVNDLAKGAASRLGVPYACVPTAPSMNGYTSNIVAMLDAGLKTTTVAPTPAAIVSDTDILAGSPHEMALAGFGDLLSKNISGTDWWISHHLTGAYFCELPLKMVSDSVPWARNAAPRLAAREAGAIGELGECLLVSGLSMTVAGVSSPSSGGEHMISHVWEMSDITAGRPVRLHGRQIGVSSVMMATLYDRLRAIDRIDVDKARASYRDLDEMEEGVNKYHGAIAPLIWKEFQPKLPSQRRLSRISETWDEMRVAIDRHSLPSEELRELLATAGAPVDPAQIGLSAREVTESIIHAREIRGRYTVLDLAADIGILEEFSESV